MILRSEQGPDNREPLWRDGNPPLTASPDELAESLIGVPLMPPSIDQPDFSHKELLAELMTLNTTENQRSEKNEVAADR